MYKNLIENLISEFFQPLLRKWQKLVITFSSQTDANTRFAQYSHNYIRLLITLFITVVDIAL